jgi:hypothetical protein
VNKFVCILPRSFDIYIYAYIQLLMLSYLLYLHDIVKFVHDYSIHIICSTLTLTGAYRSHALGLLYIYIAVPMV